jgi:hypothetical protein
MMDKARQHVILTVAALAASLLSLGVSCATLIILAGVVVLPSQTGTVPEARDAGPVGGPSAPVAAPIAVEIDEVEQRETTVVIGFTVTQSGPQALFFDTPELDRLRPTADSLEQARFALLDTVAAGEAVASLEFPLPPGGAPWTLVFNPGHEPGDYVAPRVEVEVSP